MVKKQKAQNNYHSDPRNEIEKFLFSRIPTVSKAYGLGSIKFCFMTIDKMSEDMPTEGVMCIEYDPIYKIACIMITPNAVNLHKDKEYKTISDCLVHEMGHIVTDRLGKLARQRHTTKKDIEDAIEETTETIAQIARKLLSKEYPATFK